MVLSARDSEGKVSQGEAFPGRGFSSQGTFESRKPLGPERYWLRRF
jgi:hypothetical protein